MANPVTPEDWLPVLAQRLDANMPNYRLLKRYVDGDAPLPEMGANVKLSWVKFQRMSRTNWGELIRDAVVDRIVPNGITIRGKSDSPEAKQAQRIWRDNHMDTVFKDWLRYGLTYRKSFLTVWRSGDYETISDGEPTRAIITADSPDTMWAATDPLQPWKIRAAIRWWRDYDAETDYAMVWTRNAWQRFRRSIYVDPAVPEHNKARITQRCAGKWDAEGDPVPTLEDRPPVFIYNNPGNSGEFENHVDLINRINTEVLQLLAITSMQAFRQRGIIGGMLPTKDAEGNDIDWTKVFEAAPGALWNLPENLQIWESTPTDISPVLIEIKDHIRQLSAVTRTPFSTLIPDSANQSAEGAKETKEGLIFKSAERLTVAAEAAEAAIVRALAVEGTILGPDDNVELLFEPVAMVTLAEKYQAASLAKAAGESWRSIARNILGYNPDQINQDTSDRADELLANAAIQQQVMEMTQPALPAGPQGSTPPRPTPNTGLPSPQRAVRQSVAAIANGSNG